MKRIVDSLGVKIGVVMVILIGLVMAGKQGIEKQRQAYWRDGTRKDDVNRLRQAVVDYFKDNESFPDEKIFLSCGSGHLLPYIKAIPCDPMTGEIYPFQRVESCKNCYEFYVKLENSEDIEIKKAGCNQGCGPEGEYNYKVRGQIALPKKE